MARREDLLFGIFIVAVRFLLLDLMLFYVSRVRRSLHLDLLQIVFAVSIYAHQDRTGK